MSSQIKFTLITLFPEALAPYLDSSMLYKAQNRGILEVEYVNLREFGLGPHKSVDDTPYGGGDGMLLRCEPVFAAVEQVKVAAPEAEVILPTPVGMTWNQALARQFAGVSTPAADAEAIAALSVSAGKAENAPKPTKISAENVPKSAQAGAKSLTNLAGEHMPKAENRLERNSEAIGGQGSQNRSQTALRTETALETPQNSLKRHFIIICPHYEGYDERILALVDHQISLGPYVLTGGELAALVIIDSVTRLLPGVLGGENSAAVESFSAGDNLEYPQYTKPADFRGLTVPEVLLSGNHAKIAAWRAEQSAKRRQRK